MTDYPDQVIIKTDAGVYHLKITAHRDKQIIESYTIDLDSRDNKCVQLSVPSVYSKSKKGTLVWVKAEENCSFEKYIEKGLAYHMVLLGLTLARDINPALEKITLDDLSGFLCKLPDNKEYKVHMRAFHIAFHGSTWYEYYFKAELVKDYDKYCVLKENLYNPDKKPEAFNFNNLELEDELMPLYIKASTWAEFFDSIEKKYGKKKCGVVYPWILNAMYVIFEDDNIFDNYKWIINLDRLSRVPFKSYENLQKGGVTRKRVSPNDPIVFLIDIPEVNSMNYKKFIHGR